MTTLKDLQDQLNTECSLIDRHFEVIDGRLSALDVKFSNVEKKVDCLDEKIEEIRGNHLEHLKTTVTQNTLDLEWVKKIQWWALVTSIGAMITIIANLVINLI